MFKLFSRFFAAGIALALIVPLFIYFAPVASAEEVGPPVETDQTEVSEPYDLKKRVIPDDEVPDLIDYSVALEKKYIRRAYEKENSLNEIVFQKSDGSFDSYVFAFPVKYETAEGEVLDKSPELVQNATLAQGKYRFSTSVQNNVSLQCADVASDGIQYASEKLNLSLRPKTSAEASFGLEILQADEAAMQALSEAFQSSVSLSPVVTAPVVPEGYSSLASLSQAQSALSASSKQTAAARYSLSEGNSLSVVPSYNGFQISVDLAENRTEETLYFELSTGGKTLSQQDGTYVLLNSDGTPAGILGDAVLSNESGVVETVPVQVTQIRDGEYLLAVNAGDSASLLTIGASDYYDYVEDTTIYSASPNTVAGSSANLYVGYQASRGIQRILMRVHNWNVTELTHNGYTITGAVVHMRDIMGMSNTTVVECRPFTGGAWTESSATWNSVYANSYGDTLYTVTMNSNIGWQQNYAYSYDITPLVQGWYNGTADYEMGFMLKASAANEASTTTAQQYYASSQYGTESYRPYLTFSSAYTGTVSDGVYYIRSAAGGYLTSTYSSLNGSNVFQRTNKLSTDPLETMNQLWRVSSTGNGYYTIRPYHYTPAGLTVSQYDSSNSTNVDIYSIGYSDDMDDVPSFGLWNIGNMRDSNGLYGTYYSLTYFNAVGWDLQNYSSSTDGGNISIGDNYGDDEHKWAFEPVSDVPSEVLFYDAETGLPESNPNRAILVDDSKRILAELGFDISMSVPGNLNPLHYAWSCVGPGCATLDTQTLRVTGLERGSVTVRVSYPDDGVQFYAGFTLHIVNGISDGQYFIQNAKSFRYVDIENQVMQNGTTIHQWSFHGGATSRWDVQLQDDGYYTIRSLHSGTTDYYLGVENNSSADGARVILCSGPITDGMRWSFSRTDSGSYKIIPKCGSSGRILAVEYGSYQEALGLDIKSLTYSNDGYDSDEWYLRNLDDTIEDDLMNMGLISGDDIISTDDGFHMITKPLFEIYYSYGLQTAITSMGSVSLDINFDNLYLFAVSNVAKYQSGILAMYEQELDNPDRNYSDVTIPFLLFDDRVIKNYLLQPTVSSGDELISHVEHIIFENINREDDNIFVSIVVSNYFADASCKAPYLIADEYIGKIVDLYGSTIPVPEACVTLMGNPDHRLSGVVSAINDTAGYHLYNSETNTISIENIDSLTLCERQMILACFLGNDSFNSFAAEVVFHAFMISKEYLGEIVRSPVYGVVEDTVSFIRQYDYDVVSSSLRADMSVTYSHSSISTDPYYGNGVFVVLQRFFHEEY